MVSQSIVLYNTNSVVILTAVFGLVCVLLIGFMVKSMMSSDRKNDQSKER